MCLLVTGRPTDSPPRFPHTFPSVGAIEANDPALSQKNTEEFPSLGTEFPSLGAAPKDKKKKKQTMSLADFQSSGSGGRPSSYGDLPTGPRSRVDLNSLPTGPRARGPGEEDLGPPMGGGFRGYGGDRDFERRPSRYGDGDRRGPPRDREDEMMPSRADEVDDWGSERKFVPSDRGERRGFGGGFRDDRGFGGGFREEREFGGDRRERGPLGEREPSRADEVDDWGSERKFVPSDRGERRGFGGGFREDRGFGDRREGGFGRAPSRADEVDRWGQRQTDNDDGGEKRERPRLKLKPRSKPVGEATEASTTNAAIFGGAKPVDTVAKEVEEKLAI